MSRPPLLIPIENQVRELDAKLLLAAQAVARGHDCYIGWKGAIDGHLNRFPQGVYISKSQTSRNIKVLRICRWLGHAVVGWDEEAIVHYPPDIYYARRLDRTALELTDCIYAWGDDNKHLFEGHPEYPGTRLKVVGNPRGDLLRKELRPFFAAAAQDLKKTYGDFILINTNFGTINGFYPEMNVCYRKGGDSGELVLGRGASGFPPDFAYDLYAFRVRVLDAMKELVPAIAEAFPDRNVILRPHPAENRDMWREHLKRHDNVHVIAEGNVVPWLIACEALVHNSCTTAVESYILKRPVVAYVPFEGGDDFATEPPHKLSLVCSTSKDVIASVEGLLKGKKRPARGKTRDDILAQFVSALDGDLAAVRIVRSIEDDVIMKPANPVKRALGSGYATIRRMVRQSRMSDDGGRYSIDFKRQRFPDVTEANLKEKLERLGSLSNANGPIDVERIASDLFRLSPGS